ncbi:MAG: hypothetical protein Q4A41_02475 [Bacillota bacterium]|nr:hypothetical protein [Bacillota bacterium]
MRKRNRKIYFTVTALFNAGVKTEFIKEVLLCELNDSIRGCFSEENGTCASSNR